MHPLITMELTHWNERLLPSVAAEATAALEDGNVLFMPHLKFELVADEERLLDPQWLAPGAKTISYDPHAAAIGHTAAIGAAIGVGFVALDLLAFIAG